MTDLEIKKRLVEKILEGVNSDDELITLVNLDMSSVIEDAARVKLESMSIEELLELL